MMNKMMMTAAAALALVAGSSLTGCGAMTPEKQQALMALSGQIQSNTNAFLAGQQQVIDNMTPKPPPNEVYTGPINVYVQPATQPTVFQPMHP
jgi:hypothetical protein